MKFTQDNDCTLKYKSDIEQFLVKKLDEYTNIYHADNIRDLHVRLIADLGILIKAEQVYYFKVIDPEKCTLSLLHHWVDPQSSVRKQLIYTTPKPTVRAWLKILNDNELLQIKKPDHSGADATREIKAPTLSLIIAPIFFNGCLHGGLSIEHRQEKEWIDLFIPSIRIITSLVGIAIGLILWNQVMPNPASQAGAINPQKLVHKSRLESLGVLTAGLVHEINQPITAISLGIENIQLRLSENNLENDYLKEKCDIISNQFLRIRSIINHIRIFSREPKSIHLELIDINQSILNTLSLFRSEARRQNITVVTNLDPNTSHTLGDLCEFEQIIINLYTNARDAVNEKEKPGAVSDYSKEITVKTFLLGTNICIQVSDNGIGISNENREKIFQPFFTTKDEEIGTGLGLSVVQTIVNQMKGSVTIESKENKSTTVTVLLPNITPLKN
jgi:signal transduction histidine kinase